MALAPGPGLPRLGRPRSILIRLALLAVFAANPVAAEDPREPDPAAPPTAGADGSANAGADGSANAGADGSANAGADGSATAGTDGSTSDSDLDARAQPTSRTPQVTITATRAPIDVLDTAGNVTIIEREDIEKSGARDVPDLLRREAGIYVTNTTTNREGNTMEARGFNNGGGNGGRTLVMIDGRRVNEEDSSRVDWSFITLDNVDRIEIVRGPVSAAYGDNALAGVVHIRTLHLEEDGVEGTVRGRLGTYDTFQTSARALGREGPVSIWAFFDYDSTDAYRDRADFRGTTAEMDIRLQLGEYGSLSVKGGYGSNKRLRPGDLTQEQMEEDRRQFEPGSGDNFDIARQRYVQATLELALNEHVSFEILPYHRRRTDDSSITDPFSAFDADSETDALGLKTQMRLDFLVAGMRNQLLIGGDLLQEDVDNGSFFTVFSQLFGDSTFPARTSSRRKLWGVFLHNELWLTEQLMVSFGARYDEATYKASDRVADQDFRTAHSEWAPKAAVTWRFHPAASVYASYARGYRFPNQNEAFGFFGFQPGLIPETSSNYEVGAKLRTDHATFNLAVYHMNVEDEIFFNPVALNPFFLPLEITGVNVNLDRVRHRGVEVSGSVYPAPWLELWAQYTYEDVEIRRDTVTGLEGSILPITPKHRGFAGARVFLPYGFQLGFHSRLVGSRYVANDITNSIEKLTRFVTYDARVAWKYEMREWLVFEVEGIAYNLTDREYNEFAGLSLFGGGVGFFPSPERHYVAGVRLTLRR